MPCHSSLTEALTQQFYDWEMRGRGWQIWDRPVALEPPFRPFLGHFVSGNRRVINDDGRKPTALTHFVDSLFKKRPRVEAQSIPALEEEPVPTFQEGCSARIELQVLLPPDTKVIKDAALPFLTSLGELSHPASFEIVGTSDAIVVQLAVDRRDGQHIKEQLKAHFPDASLTEPDNYLETLWGETAAGKAAAIVEYGLSQEFVRPLRCFERFDPDPLAGVIGTMMDLTPSDVAVFQVLFAPLREAWAESITRAVTDGTGDSFFMDDPAIVKLATEKISAPLSAAVIRVAVGNRERTRAWDIAQRMGKSLAPFADAASNHLIPLSNEGYDESDHCAHVVTRQTCRSGLILNANELVSLVHLPSASVQSAKLKREDRKTKGVPSLAVGNPTLLGENHHRGKTVPVTLTATQRMRHMHVIGASGGGKSTLLLQMIVQDIERGEGIAVLDPHGDLIDEILGRIPEKRIPDVVLFDPSDEAYPVGFNILSAHSELERTLLSSDLVAVFRRLSTSFGDQMTTVLGNAILAFLESDEGGTLFDLRRFLVEPAFRERLLSTVRDAEIVYYWQKEFPLLAGKPQGPILTRLDAFLRPKVIRHMVSQKKDHLDFGAMMNSRKIFLAKLSQGLIGEENSYLLGTLLVAKLNQTATSRQSVAAAARLPFYLYIDEFHNFVTPSLAALLTGVRKYNLGLILAHQELSQLKRDSDVLSAVISNPYARVCFRLGDDDAKKMEDGFSFFKAKDLQNLGVGEAIVRLERADYDFNLKTMPLLPIEAVQAAERRSQIVASSRDQYAMRREEVEADLRVKPAAAVATEREAAQRRTIHQVDAVARKETPSQKSSEALAVPLPGRGGEHHKYLQQLIKRWAETRGYRVEIEKPILGGLGSVDVALEKGTHRIACEVSVTTNAEHETGNVEKCLAAGFEVVILIASEKKVLAAVRHALVAALSTAQYRQVKFLNPEETFLFLESFDIPTAALPVAPDPRELMTAKEVEELLRIDVKTVYSYVKRGILPYVKIQSNVRFIRSAMIQWMQEKQYKPGAKGSRKQR